jgi:hypothetical protein
LVGGAIFCTNHFVHTKIWEQAIGSFLASIVEIEVSCLAFSLVSPVSLQTSQSAIEMGVSKASVRSNNENIVTTLILK